MDIRQTPEWGEFLKSYGWKSVEVEGSFARVKTLGFAGSIIKVQRPKEINEKFLKKLDLLAQKERALFIKLEPNLGSKIDLLASFGFRGDLWPTLASKTILLKTSKDPASDFPKDARYVLRKMDSDLKVEFFEINDKKAQEIFYELFKKSGQRAHFFVPSLQKDIGPKCVAFKNKGFIVNAFYKKVPCATAMILYTKDMGFYAHAGNDSVGIKQHASYKIIEETLKKLYQLKIGQLDLEGIYDTRYESFTKNWAKFSMFKKNFGGTIVEFPGSFIKYRSKFAKFFMTGGF